MVSDSIVGMICVIACLFDHGYVWIVLSFTWGSYFVVLRLEEIAHATP